MSGDRQHGKGCPPGHQPGRLLPAVDGGAGDRAPPGCELPAQPVGAATGAGGARQQVSQEQIGTVGCGGHIEHPGQGLQQRSQTKVGQLSGAVQKTTEEGGGAMLVEQVGYGYRGPNISAADRDPLMSSYVGLPAGIVRSAFELAERLAGRSVCYRRAPMDEDRQANLRKHIIAQLEKERIK